MDHLDLAPMPRFTFSVIGGCVLIAAAVPGQTPLPHLPSITAADKQVPDVHAFGGCRADGNYGTPRTDRAQNHLKNRVDQAATYAPVLPSALTELKNYNKLKGVARERWRPSTLADVETWEGIPVALVGVLVDDAAKGVHGVQPEKAEATNCGDVAADSVDWHGWKKS